MPQPVVDGDDDGVDYVDGEDGEEGQKWMKKEWEEEKDLTQQGNQEKEGKN